MNWLLKLASFAALACLVIVQPAFGASLVSTRRGNSRDKGTTADWSLVTGGPYTSLWTGGWRRFRRHREHGQRLRHRQREFDHLCGRWICPE